MDNQTIQLKKLKDLQLTDKVIDAESAKQAILDNKSSIEELKLNIQNLKNESDLSDAALIVKTDEISAESKLSDETIISGLTSLYTDMSISCDKMVGESIELMSNRLDHLTFNIDKANNLEYLAEALRDIITSFGGKLDNEGVSEVQFSVSEADIAAGRGALLFTVSPLLAGVDPSEDDLSVTIEKIN